MSEEQQGDQNGWRRRSQGMGVVKGDEVREVGRAARIWTTLWPLLGCE